MLRHSLLISLTSLLLLGSATVETGGGGDEVRVEVSEDQVRKTFFGHPYLPGNVIEAVLTDGHALDRLHLSSNLTQDERQRVLSSLERLERAAQRKISGEWAQLRADGCAPAWTSDEEALFATGESGNKSDLEDLFISADRVVFARVIEVEPALLGPATLRMASLVTVEIIEDLAEAEATLTLTGTATYADSQYSLQVAGTTICANRPGFHIPRPGDLFALLLRSSPYFEENYNGDLYVTNSFPVIGGEIQPQPYPFLDTSRTVTVSEVRALRLMSSSTNEYDTETP